MLNEIASNINSTVASAKAVVNEPELGDHSITVESGAILEVCRHLKNDQGFNVLHVISAVDYPDKDIIELNYMLSDYKHESGNKDLTLKTNLKRGSVSDLPSIQSVVSVWKAADWQERETFDMMGVRFENHPDHRRILCPDDWEGPPLRKDYVVQEVYNGMTVNPEEKINNADHFFGKKLIEEIGDPKKISWSWKDKDETPEETSAGEEATE